LSLRDGETKAKRRRIGGDVATPFWGIDVVMTVRAAPG